LWPDRDYAPHMDILIAGCGTNQAAVFAHANRRATVVAIDVSQASLDHHEFLKKKYDLKNLELHRLPIEDIAALDRQFDLIVSSGVLHHLADPLAGLRSLAGVLRPDGVIGIMLYATYGRVGVEILQSVFRDLGLGRDPESIGIVRETLATLGPEHPVMQYLEIAPDLRDDGGLVDTFLHGRDRTYTVDGCIELVEEAGLVFQDWFLRAPYYPPTTPQDTFHCAVAELPLRTQWSIMERIRTRNGCHFFLACRPERAPETYTIDFDSEQHSAYIPVFRHACGVDGTTLSRHDWALDLDPLGLAFVRRISGHRSIGEIVTAVAEDGGLPAMGLGELTEIGRRLFQSLWQMDFIAIKL
ncbi:MAG: methyltransferase domain-containing protein, partial [Acidobacteria bacterium]|nr:methyltransferase domain-containing protein [Acidobacteriota bacterium]